MGFFDRFKKNKQQEEEQPVEQKQPLILSANGRDIIVNFGELVDVDGKIVNSSVIVYSEGQGGMRHRRVLLEPITKQNEQGVWVDATEEYYKQIANGNDYDRDEIYKFFDDGLPVGISFIANDYMGNLAKDSEGRYFVHVDEEFNALREQKAKGEIAEKNVAAAKKESEFENQLRSGVNSNPNVKSSHVEHLTPEMYQQMYPKRPDSPDVR